jgi:hypothetical protein
MPRAHADTTTTTGTQVSPDGMDGGACGITESDLAGIKAIQDNTSLSYLDELQQELAARRNLLSETIQCAEASAEQAKTDLDNTSVDPSLGNLKNQWSGRLGDAISYYNLQLQKVNEVGISGTESIAKDVLAWRENNYAPLAENVLDFVAWSNNQTLFTTAESRLAQINNLAASPLFSESSDVQNNYEEAAVSLKTAEDQNTAAKNAFAQSLSPDQSLLFIKQSLDSLSSTYQYFFNISNLVQSLLPH